MAIIRTLCFIFFVVIITANYCLPQGLNQTAVETGSLQTENLNEIDSYDLMERSSLTHDWWGARQTLRESGIEFDLVYTGESFTNLAGGISNGSTYLDNIDIILGLDLALLMGLTDTKATFYVLGNNGGVPCEKVGIAQGISNIAAPNTWKIYEAWIEKELFAGNLSLLVGLYDYNSEFDTRETSGIFINPSHGIGPDIAQSGLNGPSIFPTTSLALRIKSAPFESVYLLAAIFDGVPGNVNDNNGTEIVFNSKDGLFLSAEVGIVENDGEFLSGYGKYSIGGWYYTSEFDDILLTDFAGNPVQHNDNLGVYISFEKFLFSELNHPDQGFSAFARFGLANSDINQFNYYWGTGFSWSGIFSDKSSDILGFAIGTAHNGIKYRNLQKISGSIAPENEMDLEITYSTQIAPWLRIQPDIQYVINPIECNTNNTSFLFGTRFEITF